MRPSSWITAAFAGIQGAALALNPLSSGAQTLSLPARATNALTGTVLAQRIADLSLAEREQTICSEILGGNIPDFLRNFCPIQVTHTADGKSHTATFFVTPDYLAVGSEADYLLMPLSPGMAQQLADKLQCSLPTRKMVDVIYAAAEVKLPPLPIPPSPAMTSVSVFSNHSFMVREQRNGKLARHPLGALVAGHKKDVVISAKLATAPGKVAIYGWHHTNGIPIQPLYLGHTANWVDYSQCIRLISQTVLVDGTSKTVSEVLGDPLLCGFLSDEGIIRKARYGSAAEAGGQPVEVKWHKSAAFNEQVAELQLEPDVRVVLNAPAEAAGAKGKKVLLVFYALPNGNTTEQTMGKALKPGDDWHFDIQHIGAQTRFLRELITERILVVAGLENSLKSWPAWRKAHGDGSIPALLTTVKKVFAGQDLETVLSGHSGGGSLIFGFLNALEAVPADVVRIAFLDSNYAYDASREHARKLATWLNASDHHALCVLAYNDATALLDGKSFVSAAGGTWGKSHEMQRDLARYWPFTNRTNADFEFFSALNGHVQLILRENPDRKILHTVQVERNGFIHSLVTGTPAENQGYEYFGPRAYSKWIKTE